MTSNYPPGVSGNEPQIVGYDEEEATMHVECIFERRGSFEGMGDWEEPCGFSGDVDGVRIWQSRYEFIFVWECPTCGNENEETGEYDPEAAAQEAREERGRDER